MVRGSLSDSEDRLPLQTVPAGDLVAERAELHTAPVAHSDRIPHQFGLALEPERRLGRPELYRVLGAELCAKPASHTGTGSQHDRRLAFVRFFG